MRSSWKKAKVEVPAARWADVSQKENGVSLLNRSKYGYDIKGNTMRLSLLRSPKWPDATADRGKHSMGYSLYPHTGNWKGANTVARGYEINNPLIVASTTNQAGRLPESNSFARLAPVNLLLTTIKKAEDSNAWIVQRYETRGDEAESILTLPKTPTKVVSSNFLKEDGAPVAFVKNIVKVATKRNSVVTLNITF